MVAYPTTSAPLTAKKPEIKPPIQSKPVEGYIISRHKDKDEYGLWRVDSTQKDLLTPISLPGCPKLDRKHQLIPIGKYILEWGPIELVQYTKGVFPYRLIKFDPTSQDPLGIDPKTTVRSGLWTKKKFWGSRPDFGNPQGPSHEYDSGDKLLLLPLGTFILNVIPTTGRGTYRLFSFDPGSRDPLDQPEHWISGSFGTIEYGHDLIPLENYVLDFVSQEKKYWLWSFDPMHEAVLARPPRQSGTWNRNPDHNWAEIDDTHKLIPIGEHVLDWDIQTNRYRLWQFNPHEKDPLRWVRADGSVSLEREGDMPSVFAGHGDQIILTGVQDLSPPPVVTSQVQPGTIEAMRKNIKHVVYYMVENRSLDHVCGWLYQQGQNFNRVGHFDPGQSGFDGASTSMRNWDPDNPPSQGGPRWVHLDQRGEIIPPHDPYHDMTDTTRQCFSPYKPTNDPRHPFEDNRNGYAEGKPADMNGFVWNNGMPQVMSTFTPTTLPVLNGLARDFAVSDRWFSSMPGATASQRAFALTGSALLQLNNFMNGPQYVTWPDAPHRASIWKVLYANGFTDWKIYNSVQWFKFEYTYHLYLEGQIPSVDKRVQADKKLRRKNGKYIASLDQFLIDARSGDLPKFSFVEPVWIGGRGRDATSYHPYGGGGVEEGERALNKLYEALRDGKKWDETLLIITFDEHGGFFDHVAPPRTVKPWPNDVNDGFEYDLMGVRVPTILVSPWIEQNTVFRAPLAGQTYDSTSILATLLEWYGIPKARWGLGDRTQHAPTFEGVFTRSSARPDQPDYTPPMAVAGTGAMVREASNVDDQIIPWIVYSLVPDPDEAKRELQKISAMEGDDITKALDELADRFD